MKINRKLIYNLSFWAIISIISLETLDHNPVMSETEFTEIEELCSEYPHNSVCKDQESYISQEIWKQNKTICSLATKWKNEERKCKVVAKNNLLTIHVENGVVSESLSKTFKTKVMTIALDDIFSFDTQWWLADVDKITSETSNDSDSDTSSPTSSTSTKTSKNTAGTFTNIQIGFITSSKNKVNPDSNVLTISAKNLHQILEQMEAWRYYLPDIAKFEEQLKFKETTKGKQKSVAENIAHLKKTNNCPGCDLRAANLAELDLSNANLQGANLAKANLEKTKLVDAYLLGANLNQAKLIEADLETANLIFASLEKADLFKAEIKGANLQHANLQHANLTEAELNADGLKVTSFKNANLNNVNFTDADLRCVNFQSANLQKANLTNANLSLCEKRKSLLSSFQLSNLKLNNANVPYTVADDISNVVNLFSGIIQIMNNPSISSLGLSISVPQVKYKQASNLSGANLSSANLSNTNLSEVDLAYVNLSKAILADAKLSKNNLSNTNFIDTDVSEIEFKDPILICEAIFSDDSVYDEYCIEEEEKEEEKDDE